MWIRVCAIVLSRKSPCESSSETQDNVTKVSEEKLKSQFLGNLELTLEIWNPKMRVTTGQARRRQSDTKLDKNEVDSQGFMRKIKISGTALEVGLWIALPRISRFAANYEFKVAPLIAIFPSNFDLLPPKAMKKIQNWKLLLYNRKSQNREKNTKLS